ncbi:T9SS type A sorting domain-containing protein [candidate division KSB1 bacterium]|nr:T9SS type A sorting domain-containing protein [candidate division KSB1 bacterium]
MKTIPIFIILFLIVSVSGIAYQKQPHRTAGSAPPDHQKPLSNDVLMDIQHKINRFLYRKQSAAPVFRSTKSQLFALKQDGLQQYRSHQDQSLLLVEGENLNAGIESSKSPGDRLRAFIDRAKLYWNLKHEDDRLVPYESRTDKTGMTHVRLQQLYANLPVYGHELYLHIDTHNRLRCINGRVDPIDHRIDVNPAITAEEAKRQAAAFLKIDSKESSSQLLIYPHRDSNRQVLSYLVTASPALDQRWEIFVDANSGEILHAGNRTAFDGPVTSTAMDLSGEPKTFSTYQLDGQYYLLNAAKDMFDAARSQLPDVLVGGILVLSAENANEDLYYIISNSRDVWGGFENGVSASVHGNVVYDYYHEVHNRNSIDDEGGSIYVVVNYKENYNNAFWNGKLIVFGNGDNERFSDIAGALDVTAHEMTHGVVEFSANLIYEFQSGALNECFADVFGTAVEFYYEGANADWLIGEDVTTPNIPGDALRDMQNPSGPKAVSKLPGHMNEYRDLPNTEEGDWGGVHINVGIPNRAFALASNAIGINKTERIYYQALTNYITRSSQFIDARLAMVRVAGEIYGVNSVEQNAIKTAFDQVGITADEPTPPPQNIPEVQGEDWILAVDSQSRILHRVNLDASIIEPISSGQILSKPSVPDDGSYILYVDMNYNPRILALDGSQEEILDESSLFRNISVSPDGATLAAISSQYDNNLYIVGIGENEEVKTYQLYAKTYTEGVQSPVVRYADALDWTLDNRYILYDAYNEISSGQSGFGYWDINLIRVSDGAVERIFPAQSTLINIGNPALASNNNFIIAYDYVDEYGTVFTRTANLETGETGQVNYNGTTLSYPDFSPNDDAIIFQYNDGSKDYIYVTGLQNDGLNGDNNFQQFLVNAIYPLWIRQGQRPQTEVTASEEDKIPSDYQLKQNHPNPFNNSTTIEYSLPASEYVNLSVFNASGQLVKVLVEEEKERGKHRIQFDASSMASGVYFYCLSTADAILQKKLLLVR